MFWICPNGHPSPEPACWPCPLRPPRGLPCGRPGASPARTHSYLGNPPVSPQSRPADPAHRPRHRRLLSPRPLPQGLPCALTRFLPTWCPPARPGSAAARLRAEEADAICILANAACAPCRRGIMIPDGHRLRPCPLSLPLDRRLGRALGMLQRAGGDHRRADGRAVLLCPSRGARASHGSAARGGGGPSRRQRGALEPRRRGGAA
ncbi:hypothetical protein LX81_02895 [Palleronia aestuarii]|uniref:Uncharacterized protein n=1 Tax=Palleronia aestuarii TaxID=568105 RepID=A0A2W7NST5_9RHOB|nr:hypothetical protein LX81_02895 [Palleronia aestuarii]